MRLHSLARLGVVLTVVLAACARPGGERADIRRLTIVGVSDWHGQLDPLTVRVDGRARPLAGAAALKVYFDREHRRNPGGTLVVTAGDAFGATPPLASFLDDVPAVEIQNSLGFDVDTLGNHSFDHGLARLRELLGLARFPHVAANVVGPDGGPVLPPTKMFVLHEVRVGVIGIAHPDTPALVAPGRTGDWRFLAPVPVVNAHARRLRAAGAQIVLVLAHVGADGVAADGAPLGALGDLARGVRGVDVLVGDHSDVSVNAMVGGTLVVENRSKGAEYSVIELQWDATRGALGRASAVQRRPWADEVAPDPAIGAQIEAYRARVRPLFDRPVGAVLRVFDRSREAESRLGNFETDTLRTAYGTEIAFDVSGALRDDLPSSYEPADHGLRRPGRGSASGPPFDVVQGDLVAVFPFDNVAVTFRITGRALWEALENSVSQGAVEGTRFRNAAGRFLQVSGFAYRFDPRRPSGQRVHDVRLADGTPVGRDGREYTAATSDFVYQGGDGYAMIAREARGAVTRELIAATVARAIREGGPADARIEGRIRRTSYEP